MQANDAIMSERAPSITQPELAALKARPQAIGGNVHDISISRKRCQCNEHYVCIDRLINPHPLWRSK